MAARMGGEAEGCLLTARCRSRSVGMRHARARAAMLPGQGACHVRHNSVVLRFRA